MSQLGKLEAEGIAGKIPLDQREALKAELKDAEAGAEKAYRRAVKAKVKADDAARTVDALDPGVLPEKDRPDKK
jgi:hypothetical protein